jgi:hypothetical protein
MTPAPRVSHWHPDPIESESIMTNFLLAVAATIAAVKAFVTPFITFVTTNAWARFVIAAALTFVLVWASKWFASLHDVAIITALILVVDCYLAKSQSK